MTDTEGMNAEANAFALELLVPTSLLRADLAFLGRIDLEDEPALKKLASKYRVSQQVMILRIGQVLNL